MPCRYWAQPAALFSALLDMGAPPLPGDDSPACSRHYQLARTAVVGARLAARLGRGLSVWLFVGRRAWRGLERDWLDFTHRVRAEDLWRRMRVLAWEDLARLTR